MSKKQANKTTATAGHNSGNTFDAIIKAVMSGEKASITRQGKMIVYLFDSPDYGKKECSRILTLKGSKKTEALDAALSKISECFADAHDDIEKLREHAKAKDVSPDKLDLIVNQIEDRNKQIRAAREMFKRSLFAVYGLHAKGFALVDQDKETSSGLRVGKREMIKGKETFSMSSTSCARLTSTGVSALNAATKPAETPQQQRNNKLKVQLNAIADGSKALATALSQTRVLNGIKASSDFDDKVKNAMRDTLAELFMCHFAAMDGKSSPVIDELELKAFVVYVNSMLSRCGPNGKPIVASVSGTGSTNNADKVEKKTGTK